MVLSIQGEFLYLLLCIFILKSVPDDSSELLDFRSQQFQQPNPAKFIMLCGNVLFNRIPVTDVPLWGDIWHILFEIKVSAMFHLGLLSHCFQHHSISIHCSLVDVAVKMKLIHPGIPEWIYVFVQVRTRVPTPPPAVDFCSRDNFRTPFWISLIFFRIDGLPDYLIRFWLIFILALT